jgi:hypothetical protein
MRGPSGSSSRASPVTPNRKLIFQETVDAHPLEEQQPALIVF